MLKDDENKVRSVTSIKSVLLILFASVALGSCSPPTKESVNETNEIAKVSTSVPADSPDLSGIWQTMNTAHWNLEGHTAKKMPVTGLIGAHGGMLAGTSVVDKGEIPYRPEALVQRDANRRLDKLRSRRQVLYPRYTKTNLHARPIPDPANRYGDFYCLRMGQQQPQHFHG